MLDWSMVDLARAAAVSVSTIKRIETDDSVSLSDEMRSLVRRAFEAAGITFIDADERGMGLHLRSTGD